MPDLPTWTGLHWLAAALILTLTAAGLLLAHLIRQDRQARRDRQIPEPTRAQIDRVWNEAYHSKRRPGGER